MLADDRETVAYLDAALDAGADAKAAANWIMGDITGYLKAQKCTFAELQLTPAALAELTLLVADGTISGKARARGAARRITRACRWLAACFRDLRTSSDACALVLAAAAAEAANVATCLCEACSYGCRLVPCASGYLC